jgi:hypothetical protein
MAQPEAPASPFGTVIFEVFNFRVFKSMIVTVHYTEFKRDTYCTMTRGIMRM